MANSTDTQEEWRPVDGFAGIYEVSDQGRVRSIPRTYKAMRKGVLAEIPLPGRILTVFLTAGYPSVSLAVNRKSKTHYIHRLVCTAWHGPCPPGHEVAHNDGDQLNSKPANLRWASRRDNLADKLRHGTQPRGDDLWFTKVPDDGVREIRKGGRSDESWAEHFGISRSLVSAIRLRTKRASVPD